LKKKLRGLASLRDAGVLGCERGVSRFALNPSLPADVATRRMQYLENRNPDWSRKEIEPEIKRCSE
jgi:hypothetical protein